MKNSGRNGWISKGKRMIHYQYLKVINHRGSPEYIARGCAAGLFVTFFVPVGFQMVGALAAAYLVRGAKVPAVIMTFITNYATIFVIYPLQCWLGSHLILRPMSFAALSEQLRMFIEEDTFQAFRRLGLDLILSFLAGGFVLGVVSAIPGYYLTLKIVRAYRRRRDERRLKHRETGL